MSETSTLQAQSAESATQAAWLERVRSLPAPQRVSAIETALNALPKSPTAQNVFWRKKLLRLLDSSRLAAGLVSAADLQRENSPFTALDFRKARISFRPRPRA